MRPDDALFEEFSEELKAQLKPLYFRMDPGDMAYIPRNWLHEVHTEEASVTLTYNFIHGWTGFLRCCWENLWLGKPGACVKR